MLNMRKLLVVFAGSLLLIASWSALALGKTDPYMKSTRTQLMKARAHLFAGEADKGGYRAKAIGFTSAAIDEITAAMKSGDDHHARVRVDFPSIATSATATFQGSHMRQALIHLKQAKENLGAAAPDQGGHREKAMGLIDKAIDAVEKANASST